jgi:hypothetical protein
MLAGACVAFASAPARAAVQYVQICSSMPTGYFYIPGTTDCTNANQIAANEYDVARDFTRALTGVAMTSALVTPFIPDNARFSVSLHWATYEAVNAVGLAGAMRVIGNWSVNGGVAVGFDHGSVNLPTAAFDNMHPLQSWSSIDVLAKLGVNYAW